MKHHYGERRLIFFAEMPGEQVPPPSLSPEGIDPSGILSGMNTRLRGDADTVRAEFLKLRGRRLGSAVKQFNGSRNEASRQLNEIPQGAKQALGVSKQVRENMDNQLITIAQEWLTLQQERMVAVNINDPTWGTLTVDVGGFRAMRQAPSPDQNSPQFSLEVDVRNEKDLSGAKKSETLLLTRKDMLDIGLTLANPDYREMPRDFQMPTTDDAMAASIADRPLVLNHTLRNMIENRVLRKIYGSEAPLFIQRNR